MPNDDLPDCIEVVTSLPKMLEVLAAIPQTVGYRRSLDLMDKSVTAGTRLQLAQKSDDCFGKSQSLNLRRLHKYSRLIPHHPGLV